jgi:hypothetical protein
MQSRSLIAAIVLVAAWATAAFCAQPHSNELADEPARQEAPSPEQIARWIVELDSDRFLVRETATDSLIDAGAPAIAPLAKALRGGGLELATRGVHVLRELALCDDPATERAALATLKETASLRITAAARRAAETLAQIDVIRRDRAVAELERLGARFRLVDTDIRLHLVPGEWTLEIDSRWMGTADDLRRLRWLSDVRQVMFDNANIDGESLAHLAALEGAVYVVIKRAKIDDDALACLERLENLRQVSIVYCPVTDATVDRLARLERLSAVKLYGTRVTQTGAERLQKVLADAKIDWRKGAFLGVGGQAAPGGCTIGIVHPGSSAEAAGLRVGDVIVRYGDRDVADFDSLTALISANAPGDEVAIQFVRDGEKQTAKVTLGQWE